MLPDQTDAAALAAFLRLVTPVVIWTWLVASLIGGAYAIRLWLRARRDFHVHRNGGQYPVLSHSAGGNLRRAQVRVLMFTATATIGVFALVLLTLTPGVVREVVRLSYVGTFLVLIGLVSYDAWADDRHDRLLRTLARQRREAAT